MLNVEEKMNTIRNDIRELNLNIQKHSPETITEEIKEVKKQDLEKKSFALKKFQSILGYKTYKQREKVALRTIDSSIVTNVNTIDNMDSFMEAKIKEDFNKKWKRLSRWQIKNRITHFSKKWGDDNSFDSEKTDKLIKLLLDMKLTHKNVKYENGEIVEITEFDKILEKLG